MCDESDVKFVFPPYFSLINDKMCAQSYRQFDDMLFLVKSFKILGPSMKNIFQHPPCACVGLFPYISSTTS